jgi:hypothetical protein
MDDISALTSLSFLWIFLWTVSFVMDPRLDTGLIYSGSQFLFSLAFVLSEYCLTRAKERMIELLLYIDPIQRTFFILVGWNYLCNWVDCTVWELFVILPTKMDELTLTMKIIVIHMVFSVCLGIAALLFFLHKLFPKKRKDKQIECITSNCFELATLADCDVCCICNEENTQNSVVTPCKHYFHNDCIEQWIEMNATCPMCRFDLKTSLIP